MRWVKSGRRVVRMEFEEAAAATALPGGRVDVVMGDIAYIIMYALDSSEQAKKLVVRSQTT